MCKIFSVLNSQLKPELKFLEEFHQNNQAFKDWQKRDYDWQHSVQTFLPISKDFGVWITSFNQPVTGKGALSPDTPQSYIAETPLGQVRWKQQHKSNVWKSRSNQTLSRLNLEKEQKGDVEWTLFYDTLAC